MYKKQLAIIFSFLTFTSLSCIGQKGAIKCGTGTLQIEKIRTDSSQSFYNDMVKYKVIPSIKTSVYPVEIRIYNHPGNLNRMDIYTLQIKGDSAWVGNKRVLITSNREPADNYKVTYKDDRIMVKLAERVQGRLSSSVCELLSDLNKNHLFDHNFVNTRYITKPEVEELDSGGTGWLEVKVGSTYRNFKYQLGGNQVASNASTETYLKNIINLLYQQLKIK